MSAPPELDLHAWIQNLLAGDRVALARAITLVESTRDEDRALAATLVARLLPRTGGAHRIGISGVPGVGKSTFVDGLGIRLTAEGRRVAVLAVDPSSAISHGSILGDKTRMQALARDPAAFVRPSPAAGALGGVARHTRESILLCEAAGFDVVIVETVGVGQSETMVADMVDFLVVLMLAGGGDELQGIKRGILELADLVAIAKADGDNVPAAMRARAVYEDALRLMRPHGSGWTVPVTTCSALTGEGVHEIWQAALDHRVAATASGAWERRRAEQRVGWMWRAVEDGLGRAFRSDPRIAASLPGAEDRVRRGEVGPDQAAAELLAVFTARP
jgi:LAO/AO transport system kinase